MTAKHSQDIALPLLPKILRAYLGSNLRGRGGVTFLLARHFKALQVVPILFDDRAPVYMDLRYYESHVWLKSSPWLSSPREITEQQVIRHIIRPGDVAFDIGANVGVHTALFSELVRPGGRVFAFEPNAELLPVLSRTVHGLSNTTLYPFALADQSREAELFVPRDHTLASLANWTRAGARGKTHKVVCQQFRLDELVETQLIPLPDFIKCDVEGGEFLIFRGARNTLNRVDAPIIMFEANARAVSAFGYGMSDARDFLANLAAARYKFFEPQKGGTLVPHTTLQGKFANIFAVPESKMARCSELLIENS